MYTFISACKDSVRWAKYQIYLNISEPRPIFNLHQQVKISANRTKKQVYLHFSKAPPNFKGYANIKDSARREKYLVSTSESRKHLNFLYWARPDRELIEQAKTEGRSNPYRVFPVQSRLDRKRTFYNNP